MVASRVSVASSALSRMPERMGRVERVAAHLETMPNAVASSCWLILNFIVIFLRSAKRNSRCNNNNNDGGYVETSPFVQVVSSSVLLRTCWHVVPRLNVNYRKDYLSLEPGSFQHLLPRLCMSCYSSMTICLSISISSLSSRLSFSFSSTMRMEYITVEWSRLNSVPMVLKGMSMSVRHR